MQIFVSNPYGKINPNLLAKYAEIGPEIKQYCKENDMKIVIHSPYTLNFGIDCEHKPQKLELIFNELQVAHMIGAIGCVIHVGKHLETSVTESKNWMKYYIDQMIDYIKINKLKSKIILETSAGQGTELFPSLDNSMQELIEFYNQFSKTSKKYFKLCIDTCHIFVAGYDIRKKAQVKRLFQQLLEEEILENVAVIHFNDSKKPLGSRVDRHEAIGYGSIGPNGLSEILKLAKKYSIPCVLETPDNSYINEIPWIANIIN